MSRVLEKSGRREKGTLRRSQWERRMPPELQSRGEMRERETRSGERNR